MDQNEQFALLHRWLDPELRPWTPADGALPPPWQAYDTASTAERLHHLRLEMRELADYLPQTARRITRVATDVVLGVSPSLGLCRFIAVQLQGKTYFRYSRAPLSYAPAPENRVWPVVKSNGPAAIVYLYEEMMNGLTDPFGFVGFRHTGILKTVEQEIDTYGEMDFFDELEAMGSLDKMIELFASGGDGYLVMDLNRDLSGDDAPMAMRLSGDPDLDWTPTPMVSLFGMLDAWMAVGLGQDGPEE